MQSVEMKPGCVLGASAVVFSGLIELTVLEAAACSEGLSLATVKVFLLLQTYMSTEFT